jgi:hypothetical protein
MHHAAEAYGGVEVQVNVFLTSVPGGGGWSASRHYRCSTDLLRMLGIEPRILGCRERILVATPTLHYDCRVADSCPVLDFC